MSDMKDADVKEQVHEEKIVDKKAQERNAELPQSPDTVNQTEVNSMLSLEEEEAALRKKYGGILPKKPPLISKDSERAFFDSADWALGKPTPQQQVHSRRSAYASTDSEDGDNAASEDPDNSQ